MARPFSTVADELLEHAECIADHLEVRGYSVSVERVELGYPYTPALRCRRPPTTLIVEVYGSIRRDGRLDAWARFAKSSSRDTRVAIAIPRDAPRDADDDSMLRDLGVGLYLSDGNTIEEAIAPMDMAVNVQLPERRFLARFRRFLGRRMTNSIAHSGGKASRTRV